MKAFMKPWRVFHLATWTCAIGVAASLAWANLSALVYHGYGSIDKGVLTSHSPISVGWPVPYANGERITVYGGRTSTKPSDVTKLAPLAFSIDVVSGAILLMATLIAVESYVRSHGKLHQFTIRDLLILTVVIALYLALFLNTSAIEQAFGNWQFIHRIQPWGGSTLVSVEAFGITGPRFPWFVCLPLQLAIVCLLWDVGMAFLKAIEYCHMLISRLLPRRGLTYQPRASGAASAAERRPGKENATTRKAL